jgi:transposase InsO family protein
MATSSNRPDCSDDGQLAQIGSETLFIEPGSPWENGYRESFIGKLRDELHNGEIF